MSDGFINFSSKYQQLPKSLTVRKEPKLHAGSKSGLNWTWKLIFDLSDHKSPFINAYVAIRFEWDSLKKQGFAGLQGAFHAEIFNEPPGDQLAINKAREALIMVDGSEGWIERYMGKVYGQQEFTFSFTLKPVQKLTYCQSLDEIDGKSDMDDGVLVMEGKKLHVNKAFLAIHSEYFRTLFFSNFKEKSMKEIPMKDVKYRDFKILLAVLKLDIISAEYVLLLLELADRFLMPKVTAQVECFLQTRTCIRFSKLMAIASKYQLKNLTDQLMNAIGDSSQVQIISCTPDYFEFSHEIKARLLDVTTQMYEIESEEESDDDDSDAE